MRDPRNAQLASILVETCIGVQPGWQVLVNSGPPARPLVDEVVRCIARNGAYALPRLTFSGAGGSYEYGWIEEAPADLLATAAPIEAYAYENADAVVVIPALENTREASALAADRMTTVQEAFRPSLQRIRSGEAPWVGCFFPTPALAQDAGLSLREFEDFVYGACLLDWDAERERMSRYAERFDAAEEVRIVGEGTDLTLSLAGRSGKVDAGERTCPAASSSSARSRTRPRARSCSNGPESTEGASWRASGCGSKAGAFRTPRRSRTSRSCSSCSTRTTVPAASASSGSAATPGSRAT